MTCTEPMTVYPPQRDPWTDLAHLAVAFISRMVDRPQTSHYRMPIERPAAVIEVQKEERLKKAVETWTSAVTAVGTNVGEANSQFLNICRILDRSKTTVQARVSYRSEFEFAKKEGLAVECAEIERSWQCLIATMNAVHREEARMMCAIESARSSYILRQICPDDPCADFDGKPWPGYRSRPYSSFDSAYTEQFVAGLREKAEASELALERAHEEVCVTREKAREKLAECEKRINESEQARKDLDENYKTKLAECEERTRMAEEEAKQAKDALDDCLRKIQQPSTYYPQEFPPPQPDPGPGPQATASDRTEQVDKRRRKSP